MKIGVKEIGFVNKGRLSDMVFDRTSESVYLDKRHFTFISFAQESALLTDETVDDDKGVYHRITLDFTTRKAIDNEREKIGMLIGKPIIILIQAVDGNYYMIGDNDSPAYITRSDTYNRLTDRNVQTACEYLNLDGLFQVNIAEPPQGPTVNQTTVLVPWQGTQGNIFVESTDDWEVFEISNN